MPVQFAILASGSRGNAALIRAGGAALLIDAGLSARCLAERLASVGSSWDQVGCVLLTHTHGDHVDDSALRGMARRGIRLYCHEGHRSSLARFSCFRALDEAGLARSFDEVPMLLPNGLRIEPFRLRHDSGPTFGFRVEGKAERRGRWVGLGYLSDTGCWSDAMAEAVADVDLLGVEFNHDEELQRRSGRSPALIARVLGDRGHLSNEQGAGFLSAVLRRSAPGAVRYVVLLHLSDECNHPGLALEVARGAIRSAGRRAEIHAAHQELASPNLLVTPGRRRRVAASAGPTGFPWEEG